MNLKKCWITEQTPDTVSISLEGFDEIHRIRSDESVFPNRKNLDETRYVNVLTLLDRNDLLLLHQTITTYLQSE